ncbi:hypothetical protein [Williamsia sp. M5A3_1d]
MSDRPVTAATVVGAGLAATGVAHFVVPQAFAGITAQAFPDDTATWITRNGITETVVGTAIAIPATRRFGWIGLGAYVAFLGAQAVRSGSR